VNELALFAGAGGGLLGTRLLGWRSICYVEKDPYCIQVLKARIKDGYLDDAPIWDDVRTFDGKPWAGLVDVVTAGFPCQPFSGAGLQLGEHDERNLWPDTLRIIRQIRPRFALLENVSRLVSNPYFGRILCDLVESGYDCRWDCIPASAIGAPHQRDRLWIVSHASGERYSTTIQHQHRGNAKAQPGGNGKVQSMANSDQDQQQLYQSSKQDEISVWTNSCRSSQDVANANRGGFEECAQLDGESKNNSADRRTPWGHIGGCSDEVADANFDNRDGGSIPFQIWRIGSKKETEINDLASGTQWSVEPDVGRMAYGVAHRVDRLRAIGNGQVPAVVRAAWMLLSD
jgi:DNA (cytosine-5)-methyltransferase 1